MALLFFFILQLIGTSDGLSSRKLISVNINLICDVSQNENYCKKLPRLQSIKKNSLTFLPKRKLYLYVLVKVSLHSSLSIKNAIVWLRFVDLLKKV